MKYGAAIFLTLVFFFAPIATITHAQSAPPTGGLNDLSVETFPEIPQANQDVTLQLKTYLVDLSSADISWSIDGKVAQHGVGITVFKFTTKDVGLSTDIDVSVLPVGGYEIQKHLTITPSSVDILWEATDSAVPPFYKGKALPTTESIMKYVAIPNMKTVVGSLVSPKDMVYSWTNNFDVVTNASGFGKDSYTFRMPFVDNGENIGVTATMRGGGLSAQNNITTKIYDPKMVWYVASPLYGPQFDAALNDGYDVTSNDASIFAFPFFMSPKNILASTLSYAWQLNGDTLDAQTVPNILFLHRNDSNTGDAIVNLDVANSDKYLQEVKSSITLHLK